MNKGFALWVALIMLLGLALPGCTENKTPNSDTQSTSEVLQQSDGPTADGKYYQLTDRQGRTIMVPLGRALPILSFEGVSKTSASGEQAQIVLLSEKEEAPSYVLILSAEDSIAMGGGNIVTSDGKMLMDPDGKPYTSSEDNVLVMQYYNEKDEVVPKDSPDAAWVWAAERKYMFETKNFMIVTDIWYDLKKDEVILWNYDENPTEGKLYSDGRVVVRSWEYYRESNERHMKELIHKEINGGTFMPVKECFYGDNWTVLTRYEYAWHENGKEAERWVYQGDMLEIHGKTDELGRAIFTEMYRLDGSLMEKGQMNDDGVFVFETFDHGTLITTGYYYYDSNGNLIDYRVQYADGTWEDMMP